MGNCNETPMSPEEAQEEKEMDELMQQEYPKGSHFDMRIPLFFTNHEVEQEYLCRKHGHKSWQYNLLLKLHSNPVQICLGVLLLIDVIVLVVELVLASEFPPAFVVERSCECISHAGQGEGGEESTEVLRRFLASSGNNGTENEICYPEAKEPPHALETAEVALFSISIIVLVVFELEFFLLFLLLRDKFYRNILYSIDFMVVSVSLGLEIAVEVSNFEELAEGEGEEIDEIQTEGILAILLFVRIWRFVRIGHAIYNDASELGSHKIRQLKIKNMKLANELAEAKQMIASLQTNGSNVPQGSVATRPENVDVEITKT